MTVTDRQWSELAVAALAACIRTMRDAAASSGQSRREPLDRAADYAESILDQRNKDDC